MPVFLTTDQQWSAGTYVYAQEAWHFTQITEAKLMNEKTKSVGTSKA